MIERTFLHLPGISEARERSFHRKGIRTWRDFLERGEGAVGEGLYHRLKPLVLRSLAERWNPRYFAPLLKPKERWRLYASFPRKVFLDIETAPSSLGGEMVTVIGTYDSFRYRAFLPGSGQERFQDELARADLVVTFNGSRFDLPFLARSFPGFREEIAHIDLMYVCAAAGLRGGLKKIEKTLGIRRPASVNGLDGYAAVRLWQAYTRGDASALRRLVRYNREDTLNLKIVADWACARLAEAVFGDGAPLHPGRR